MFSFKKDGNILNINKKNFFYKVQEILEQYYLQPLDGQVKKAVQDGHIERPIHGAQHATRAMIWALMMHSLLQKLAPTYVNPALDRIAKHVNVTHDEVILLILVTVVCHDTARKGEGWDEWEEQSAAVALNYLEELGLKKEHAMLFASAIKYKDKRDNYYEKLEKLDIKIDEYNQFDYIRKLVNLGDNLDIIRCVSHFDLSYILETLKSIDDFDIYSHYEIILNLIKNIQKFIYDQYDMLFSSTIIDNDDKNIITLSNHYSKKHKVKIEHSHNVLAATLYDVLKNDAFLELIGGNFNDFNFPIIELYQGKISFDPFIHGTNSSIFSVLPKSHFEIMSPLQMIDEHQAVPITGELTRGGYEGLGLGTIKQGWTGKTSFGVLSVKKDEGYGLEKLIQNYTDKEVSNPSTSLTNFKKMVQLGLRKAFSNMNLLAIYFAQARQMHDSLDTVINKEELKLLQKNIEATMQFYYFIQLLGTHIHPDPISIEKSGMESSQLQSAIEELLTFEYIVDKIISHNINMKKIVENPTEENLTKALNILELPEKNNIKLWSSKKGGYVSVKLPRIQCFSSTPNYYPKPGCYAGDYEYDFFAMAKKQDGYTINFHLSKFINQITNAKKEYFINFGKLAKEYLVIFNDRASLITKIVNTPQNNFTLTRIQKYWLEKKYPIILLSENDDIISLYDFGSHEYRSQNSLKIGNDIKMIATDTNDHKLEILRFLEINHINQVQVVLFDDLQNSKVSHNVPITSTHHKDGVPKLKWLSAKAEAKKEYSPLQENTLIQNKDRKNHKKPPEEVITLYNDAKKFQSFTFGNKIVN